MAAHRLSNPYCLDPTGAMDSIPLHKKGLNPVGYSSGSRIVSTGIVAMRITLSVTEPRRNFFHPE